MVLLMTNSALAPASETTASKIKQKLQVFMLKLDDAFKDNFRLKREIAQEKKRYLDLMSAFLEVRKEQKYEESDEELFIFQGGSGQNDTPHTPNKGLSTKNSIDHVRRESSAAK